MARMNRRMSVDEAVLALRADPAQAQLVHDAFLGDDALGSARRFAASGEFSAVLQALGPVAGRSVLDVGAGIGLASYAFARAGAARVVALEPDPSPLVGRGAMAPLLAEQPFEVSAGLGESLPFENGAFDVVYARQVLHHIAPLDAALKEFARVLKPGGIFLGCREHVCDTSQELKAFLRAHPLHRLADNEGAHALAAYRGAILEAGLELRWDWGPLESVINAYPQAQDEAQLAVIHQRAWRRLGPLGSALARFPGLDGLLRWAYHRRAQTIPGRLHTFLAVKTA
jgi:SAM-dependent methyltransferase